MSSTHVASQPNLSLSLASRARSYASFAFPRNPFSPFFFLPCVLLLTRSTLHDEPRLAPTSPTSRSGEKEEIGYAGAARGGDPRGGPSSLARRKRYSANWFLSFSVRVGVGYGERQNATVRSDGKKREKASPEKREGQDHVPREERYFQGWFFEARVRSETPVAITLSQLTSSLSTRYSRTDMRTPK